jgi:CHAD domain-containing protein
MSEPTMREYALLQTAVLLRRLAFAVNHVAKNREADAIHDLRAAIRRFSRALRVFAQFYPDGYWKKIRRQLAGVIDASDSVRDRDIALAMLAEAGIPAGSAIVNRMETERRHARRDLLQELRRWRARSFSRKWRSHLDLQP